MSGVRGGSSATKGQQPNEDNAAAAAQHAAPALLAHPLSGLPPELLPGVLRFMESVQLHALSSTCREALQAVLAHAPSQALRYSEDVEKEKEKGDQPPQGSARSPQSASPPFALQPWAGLTRLQLTSAETNKGRAPGAALNALLCAHGDRNVPPRLESLILRYCRDGMDAVLSGEALLAAAAAPTLQHLSLERCVPATLEPIASLTRLRSLELFDCFTLHHAPSAGTLSALTALTQLRAPGCIVAACLSLTGLRNLHTLDSVDSVQELVEAVARVAPFRSLRRLRMEVDVLVDDVMEFHQELVVDDDLDDGIIEIQAEAIVQQQLQELAADQLAAARTAAVAEPGAAAATGAGPPLPLLEVLELRFRDPIRAHNQDAQLVRLCMGRLAHPPPPGLHSLVLDCSGKLESLAGDSLVARVMGSVRHLGIQGASLAKALPPAQAAGLASLELLDTQCKQADLVEALSCCTGGLKRFRGFMIDTEVDVKLHGQPDGRPHITWSPTAVDWARVAELLGCVAHVDLGLLAHQHRPMGEALHALAGVRGLEVLRMDLHCKLQCHFDDLPSQNAQALEAVAQHLTQLHELHVMHRGTGSRAKYWGPEVTAALPALAGLPHLRLLSVQCNGMKAEEEEEVGGALAEVAARMARTRGLVALTLVWHGAAPQQRSALERCARDAAGGVWPALCVRGDLPVERR